MKGKFKIEVSRNLVIAIIVLIILTILLATINSITKNRYTSIKIDDKREYVIIRYNNKKSNSFVPYINVRSADADKVNNEIKNITSSYLTSDTTDKNVTYRYNAYKNLVSVVLIFKDKINNQNTYLFKTYVLSLKDGHLLDNSEILKTFDTNYIYVNKKMDDIMHEKYEDELKNGIIYNCNFSECYLPMRGIKNYLDGANLYAENGKLIVYRAYNVYSKYKEEDYFTRDDFKFVIG